MDHTTWFKKYMNMFNNCYFKNGWCHSCGKAEGPGKELCFYSDPFWFPNLINKKKEPSNWELGIRDYKGQKEIKKNKAVFEPGRIEYWAGNPLSKKQRRRQPAKISVKRAKIYERDGWKCVYCGSEYKLTIDHMIPVSIGGTNRNENLQTCCISCNNAKANLSLDEFLESDYLKTVLGLVE